MTLPQVKTLLPDLTQFVVNLVDQYQTGAVDNSQLFAERVRTFFTPTMMDNVEHVVPGWKQMAFYDDQQTLIHVVSVLTALYLLPEFQYADSEQQELMPWIVLFHDVAKTAKSGGHDYVHGFRSAALTGKALIKAGFPVTDHYAELIDGWVTLTNTAVLVRTDLQETVQDNRKLPEIVTGIDRLYGNHSAAGMIIKGVLLHISVATDPNYPTVAPLTDDELLQYIDGQCFPLIKMMMLVDSDGWNLFDQENRQSLRYQTLAVFDRIQTQINR